MSELTPQPLVLLGEFSVPFQDGLQACAERGVRGLLGCGDCCRGATGGIAEPLDLGADVGLGIQPRAGDAGVAGDLDLSDPTEPGLKH